MPQHVAQILERAANAYPDHVALIEVGASSGISNEFTYGQWRDAALRWSAWLQQSDVRDGDRVALLAGNGLSFAAQWFGVIYAGCTVVTIPLTSTADEARHRIEHAGCRVVLCDEDRLELARAAITHVRQRPIVAVDSEVATESAPEISRHPQATGDGGDETTAMILYTSGTTGEAKGACISHRALVTHTEVLTEQVLKLNERDRVLGVLPLTHSYGCRMLLLAVAHAGATAVLMPRFDAVRSLSLIDEQRITWVPAVPTMFAAWSNVVERDPLSRPRLGSLRWAMSAGAPIADALVARAEAALGSTVRQAYGMTEATLSTVNGPDQPRIVGSVGCPAPGVELRIGDDGEIWVRGHNTMSRYLDDSAATAEVMQDGWCRSGDVGRIDSDGNLWLVDRIKDLIIAGGFNVYPAEVEAVVAEHPEVSEVAVVGRPHDYYGEEVVAFVVRRADSVIDDATLLSWCEARLSKVKRPRAVVFVERLPLGPSGKVLKRQLRGAVATKEAGNDGAA